MSFFFFVNICLKLELMNCKVLDFNFLGYYKVIASIYTHTNSKWKFLFSEIVRLYCQLDVWQMVLLFLNVGINIFSNVYSLFPLPTNCLVCNWTSFLNYILYIMLMIMMLWSCLLTLICRAAIRGVGWGGGPGWKKWRNVAKKIIFTLLNLPWMKTI